MAGIPPPPIPPPPLISAWRMHLGAWFYLMQRSLRLGCNLSRLWRFSRKLGGVITEKHGISVGRQFISLWWLAVRYQIHPELYYCYRLYLRPLSEAPLFITGTTQKSRMRFLRFSLEADLDNLRFKRRFEDLCHHAGMPVAGTVAEFEKGQVSWCHAASLPNTDLFCKHASSEQGFGADSWTYLEGRRWKAADGVVRDEAEMLAHLRAISATEPLLIQMKLKSHADVAPVSPGGISSLRVITVQIPGTLERQVIAATFKMIKAGQVTDHWKKGGVASGVDVKTGILGPGRYRLASKAHLDVHQHPDTGEAITGRKLTLWPDVIKVTTQAHALFPQFPFLGWDVALTPEGAVLLEGNMNWDARMIQQPGDNPIGAPRFFRHYHAWYQELKKRRKANREPAFFHGWKASLKALQTDSET